MLISCRTNLDLHNERWPYVDMPGPPPVGTEVQSKTVHSGGFQLSLEVVSVTMKYSDIHGWYYSVELHMTERQRHLRPKSNKNAAVGSITAFYDWYAPLVGKTPGAFI